MLLLSKVGAKRAGARARQRRKIPASRSPRRGTGKAGGEAKPRITRRSGNHRITSHSGMRPGGCAGIVRGIFRHPIRGASALAGEDDTLAAGVLDGKCRRLLADGELPSLVDISSVDFNHRTQNLRHTAAQKFHSSANPSTEMRFDSTRKGVTTRSYFTAIRGLPANRLTSDTTTRRLNST